MLWMIASALAAPCSLPRSAADLDRALESAEAAWNGPPEGFTTAMADIDPVLACMVEVIDRAESARLHRLHGLDAFVHGDIRAAEVAFAAARRIEPGYTFPEGMIAPGNPVDTLYRNAHALDGTSPLIHPKAHWAVRLDGMPGQLRPDDTPTVLQVTDNADRVVDSVWLAPGMTPPTYPTWRNGLRGPLLGVGAGLAATAGGVLAYAIATKPDATTLTAETGPDARQRQTVLGGASVGVGALAVGFVGTAFVVGRW